jgi:hypothetical protein
MNYPTSTEPKGRACPRCQDPDPAYGYEANDITPRWVCGKCYGQLLSVFVASGGQAPVHAERVRAAGLVEYPKTLPSPPALPSQTIGRVPEPSKVCDDTSAPVDGRSKRKKYPDRAAQQAAYRLRKTQATSSQIVAV